MLEENTFGDLFSEFDQVVESSRPPESPPVTAYTQSRAPSLWTRFVRWTVQGGGLLTTILVAFFLVVARSHELLIDLLPLFVIVWLVSPLLGQRPLAQLGRLPAVLFLGMTFAGLSAALIRWPSQPKALNSPITALILSCCDVIQRGTSPWALAGGAILTALLVWSARRLARANPWIETKSARRAWRRTVSLALAGLIVGLALSSLLLYRWTWNQPWISQAKRPTVLVQALADKSDTDLRSHIATHFRSTARTSDPDLDYYPAMGAWSEAQRRAAALDATSYISRNEPLTDRDISIIHQLLVGAESRQPDKAIADLAWASYKRAASYEMGNYPARMFRRFLRKVTLPWIASVPATNEQVALWQSQIDSLPPLVTVTPDEIDWVFLHSLPEFDPANRELRDTQAGAGRWKVFGIETPWTAMDLARQAERTAALLAFSHNRQSWKVVDDTLTDKLFTSLTGINLLDRPLYDAFDAVADTLPYQGFAPDRKLLNAVVQLKRERASQGVYPAKPSGLPAGVVYQSFGSTARLRTPSVKPDSWTYFDVTLK